MKKRILLFLLPFLGLLSLDTSAQIASDICLTEVTSAFRQVDPALLLNASQATRIEYMHTYVMRADPEKKTNKGTEVRMYDQGVLYHDSPDQLTVTDKKEAFNHRKNQFVIYRTRGSIDKACVLPKADPELFKHCFVRECHFVPAPGHDSISYKRAFMTVNAEGQKKYQVKDLEIITNPHDTSLVSIKVNFTPRSPYVNATYDFHSVSHSPHNPEHSPQGFFLGADGGLKEDFKGVELKDYR